MKDGEGKGRPEGVYEAKGNGDDARLWSYGWRKRKREEECIVGKIRQG